MECKIQNNNLTFRAGIPAHLKCDFYSVKPSEMESILRQDYNIDCNFANNKMVSLGILNAIKLLQEAAQRFDLPFLKAVPPKIRVFNPSELIEYNHKKFGFCIGEKQKVIKDQNEFETGSIFIKNIKDNIEDWDRQVDNWYRKHLTSSDYFLAPFFHELLHNIHLARIFGKSPEFGLIDATMMARMSFNSQQNQIIADKIGTYAKVSKMELFSETLAKMISDSIENNRLKFFANPMDKLKEFPNFVQKFIKSEIE